MEAFLAKFSVLIFSSLLFVSRFSLRLRALRALMTSASITLPMLPSGRSPPPGRLLRFARASSIFFLIRARLAASRLSLTALGSLGSIDIIKAHFFSSTSSAAHFASYTARIEAISLSVSASITSNLSLCASLWNLLTSSYVVKTCLHSFFTPPKLTHLLQLQVDAASWLSLGTDTGQGVFFIPELVSAESLSYSDS